MGVRQENDGLSKPDGADERMVTIFPAIRANLQKR